MNFTLSSIETSQSWQMSQPRLNHFVTRLFGGSQSASTPAQCMACDSKCEFREATKEFCHLAVLLENGRDKQEKSPGCQTSSLSSNETWCCSVVGGRKIPFVQFLTLARRRLFFSSLHQIISAPFRPFAGACQIRNSTSILKKLFFARGSKFERPPPKCQNFLELPSS